MELDISKLIRDKDYVLSQLVKTPDDALVCKRQCYICVPSHYFEMELGQIAENVTVMGVFPFIIEGRYSVSKVISRVVLTPQDTQVIKINDEPYHLFSFEPGSVVVKNINLLKEDTNPYYIYRCFIARGKVPWYIDYDDLLTIFEHTPKYNGVHLGADQSIVALLAATVARDPNNLNSMYRSTLGQSNKATRPYYVPLTNVQLSADDTISKILGSYMDDGINSALINPSKQISDLEEVLRS